MKLNLVKKELFVGCTYANELIISVASVFVKKDSV